MRLTAIIMAVPKGGYVAQNPETGTTTQGETIAKAIANRKDATKLYLQKFPLASMGQTRFSPIFATRLCK